MPTHVITMADLVLLVGDAMSKHTPDLHWIEVKAFVSGFHNTVGITALEEGSEDPAYRSVYYSPRAREDESKLPKPVLKRAELLRELEACCGLSPKVCEAALLALEEKLLEVSFENSWMLVGEQVFLRQARCQGEEVSFKIVLPR